MNQHHKRQKDQKPRQRAQDKSNRRHKRKDSKVQHLEPKTAGTPLKGKHDNSQDKTWIPKSEREANTTAEILKAKRPVQMIIVLCTFIMGMAFVYWYRNSVYYTADTEYKFLGLTLKSENVVIAMVGIFAVMIVWIFSRVLASVDNTRTKGAEGK